MKLDIVIPLKSSLIPLTINQTIPKIQAHLEYNNLYVLTNKRNFSSLKNVLGNQIICLDEDKIVEGLTLNVIQEYFQHKGLPDKKAGWYFQQFIKLGLATRGVVSTKYLVWDADAIVLRPINFLSKDGKILLDSTNEFHQPYFDTIKTLINIQKQVDFSFISEHFIFDKHIINAILNLIAKDKNEDWWLIILNSINPKDLTTSGFSEYELYGNYLVKYHPNSFEVRNLYKTRRGKKYLGMSPKSHQLKLFSKVFDFMSFEEWHTKFTPSAYRVIKIMLLIISTIFKRNYNSIKSLIKK